MMINGKNSDNSDMNSDNNSDMIDSNNLLGGWPTPLKNMSSSVGIMKFPTEKIKSGPNHQPVIVEIMPLRYCYNQYPCGIMVI